MNLAIGAGLAAVMLAASPADASPRQRGRADGIPARVGTCAFSQVRAVSQRLEDGEGREVPDSGSAITFANGLYQVDYAQVEAVNNSRRGDRVLICLVKLPKGCPPGDDRGRFYTTTNLRTLESWTLPDSQHMCGGA